MFWFWLLVGPAMCLAALSLRGERRRAEYVAARMTALDDPHADMPAVTVIVPVSQAGPDLAAALHSLAAQDHPNFELVVVIANSDSLQPGDLPPSVKVVIAGPDQLVQTGVRFASRRSQLLAFAGASGTVQTFWLRALVAPLSAPDVGASTGFRWYTPDPPGFWPLMRGVWNSVIAGRLGPDPSEVAWSCALAMSRDTYHKARLHEKWDEMEIAGAIQGVERTVAFAPGALTAIGGRATALEFLRQATEEMAQVRRYLPRLWWTALAGHLFYCGAMLAIVMAIARGSRGAEWALVALFGLGMLKGANRATLAKAQLPQLKTWFDRYSWTLTFWLPMATWIWLYVLIASALRPSKSGRT